MALRIITLPVLADNYIYVLCHEPSGEVVVIDPAQSEPVSDFLSGQKVHTLTIWNTHHHWDHVGGNERLKTEFQAKIIGSKYDLEHERIPGGDRGVCEGEELYLGDSLVKVLEVPGHTLGHIAFWLPQEEWLFCGDTLFAMGCGRLFEGTPDQMWKSLCRINQLPAQTKIYCTHEYTLENAKFALTVEPSNKDLKQRFEEVKALRKKGRGTLPTTLEVERKTNPFLRPFSEEIRKSLNLGQVSDVEIFAALRERKDHFKV